jgi:hypothetical protein
MRAGIGRRVVTPPVGVWLAGYAFRDHPAEAVADDLLVKALVLEDDAGNRAALVTGDIIEWHPDITEPVRDAVRRHHPNLSGDAVLFNASHTHSGPIVGKIKNTSSGHERYPAEYVEHLTASTTEAVLDAFGSLRRASVSLHTGRTSLGINRRMFVAGQMQMVPNPHGYINRELVALRVERDGVSPTVLFSIGCHPTTLNGYRFSADYPGFAQRSLERALGHGSQAMFAQSACGDVRVNVTNPEGTRFQAGTYEQAQAFGETLAREVLDALATPGEPLNLALDGKRSRIPLPMQEPMTRTQLEAFLDATDDLLLRVWAENQLSELRAGREVPRTAEIHAHWLRLTSDVQIVALGGEICGEIGQAVRELFPNRRTIFFGYTEEVLAYIPTRQIIEDGGYEGKSSQTYFMLPAPFALDMPDALLRGVQELVPKEKQ